MNREKYQFCFLVQRNYRIEQDIEIEKLGGKIYYGPIMYKNERNYCQFLLEFLKKHKEISIIHSHLNLRNCIPLKVAKDANVEMRISHCHKAENNEGFISIFKRIIIRMLILKSTTDLCACSNNAAIYLYGKSEKVNVINNAIDIDKFKYNAILRDKYRQKLKMNNNNIYGHVGNFSDEKNQTFLIDVFDKIYKNDKSATLVLIGDGKQKESVIQKVKRLGIEERVCFLGTIQNVECYYQAFDCFIFPSKSEGFGMAIIEAECSGTPCLVSEEIKSEACIDKIVSRISLKKQPDVWAAKAIEIVSRGKIPDNSKEIIKAGYSIYENVSKLEKLYTKVLEEI
ncbi:glycosyltransferase family 1 protein [Clostridium cadaveris]|uniref:glycosyltransferase n=1 Tax=Clostridium cadaveris TaxID=1529 RepID=UPI00185BB295|nr:glycosyltransferase [Clostridium cadaveris]NME63972.1 glycosyltransferase family 1 protein [Clostridium cadaveris]